MDNYLSIEDKISGREKLRILPVLFFFSIGAWEEFFKPVHVIGDGSFHLMRSVIDSIIMQCLTYLQ
jgi:hypothetical protein